MKWCLMSQVKPKTLKKIPRSSIRVVHPNAAGIDLGSESHFVSVAPEKAEASIREFRCFTPDLLQMVEFLKSCQVNTVALEATGVYWIPVYELLESHKIEVFLVNARHLKNVPGKKNDAIDSDWIRELHTFGLLNASFVPPIEIREMRDYWRLRDRHIQAASREVNHMQKAFDLMNLHPHKVISDLTGKTGIAIMQAILQGERNPIQLAQYRDSRIRCSEKELVAALTGNYQDAHLFQLQQALDLYRFYQQKIAECDEQLEKKLTLYKPDGPTPPSTLKRQRSQGNAPTFDVQSHWFRCFGVDITEIDGISIQTALTLFSEVGADFSKFKNEKHFVSWATLSPNRKISGGKVLSSRTVKSKNKVAQALRIAASTLKSNKSALGHFYRRMKARLGPAKAITATARKLGCLIYRMVTKGQEYVRVGSERYEQQIKEQQLKNLQKRAKILGYQLTEITA